jgi:hypothetical protein
MERYCHNKGLFSDSYFARVLRERDVFPKLREPPSDVHERFLFTLKLWQGVRDTLLVRDPKAVAGALRWVGLPAETGPAQRSESTAENGFVRNVIERSFRLSVVQNEHFRLTGDAAEEAKQAGTAGRRADLIIFADPQTMAAAWADMEALPTDQRKNGRCFCHRALMILDAKRFNKGVGADEGDALNLPKAKRHAGELGAADDIRQIDLYLRGYDRTWGVLTNGRSWRLVRRGDTEKHLRFDLVLLLEDVLRKGEPDDRDIAAFTLFWNLFGPPAVLSGVLDALHAESTANTRTVRDALRDNAHKAVEVLANGFWANRAVNTSLPDAPDQANLDHLRELALTQLYRLLFVLKAEAQNLLPMEDDAGAATKYACYLSTRKLWDRLKADAGNSVQTSENYQHLQRLFQVVSKGDAEYAVAAYNGGLFDSQIHTELDSLRVQDDCLRKVFRLLIYLGSDTSEVNEERLQPIPYRDLDVRDLGDIYESLLEQRLVLNTVGPAPCLELHNQKGERKASGSYFTPDSIVDHLVRKTVVPLLDVAGEDAEKILSLRIVDPAMGSGHFLVKVVDVIADHLTRRCDPVDPGAPRDNGDEERAYWRSQVVEHCVYGVDYNPMAVELAKVALWLHCARKDKPLSFLDHHLKCGNSLVGATIDRLAQPGLRRVQRKAGPQWQPVQPPPDTASADNPASAHKTRRRGVRKSDANQLWLPFALDTSLVSGVIASIRQILDRPSQRSEDVKAKAKDYADAVFRRLAAHRLLADLWCAQWFIADPDNAEDVQAYEDGGVYHKVKEICGLTDDVARWQATWRLGGMPEQPPTPATPPFIRRLKEARREGYGPRPLAFFHWQLEFPEVAFAADGKPKPGFGFHAVVGNPPWDKIKPAKRDYYGAISEEVASRQGPSLDRLISELEQANPALVQGWSRYESAMKNFSGFLAGADCYRWQSVQVNGKKTGGDPDLFRYFVERADQCLGPGGRLGLVVPCTLWQAEGCTGLRRMLFNDRTVESLYTFENYRKWAFSIDSRFKFTAFVTRGSAPDASHTFPAAFMLRDTKVLEGLLPDRVVRLDRDMIEALSPETLALLDFRCDADAKLMARLHREHPRLGDKEKSGWDVTYRCELHMTNDAWLFKSREWMTSRGFTQALPTRRADGTWTQQITEHGAPLSAERRALLPPGGEYWVAADAAYYQARNYEPRTVELAAGPTTCFIHREDLAEVAKPHSRYQEKNFRIIPRGAYTALYEGRMVHNFDHAQKAYVDGEGRKAIWRELELGEKALCPKVFVCPTDAGGVPTARAGFCDVTGATNERTTLASLVPQTSLAGNKVPTLRGTPIEALGVTAVLNSFAWDAMIRLRVSTTMNWLYLDQTPVPSAKCVSEAVRVAARLSCTTPELADYWNAIFPDDPWTYGSAERDPWKRAELRAETDAIVAELYGLSVAEYARILAGFPLLDRDQPPLPGDYFATECDEVRAKKLKPADKGTLWDENNGGVWELKPRSFITRDFALLTYIKRRMAAGDPDAYIPDNLATWFRDVVGLDPNGPLSRFRIGKVVDLQRRVEDGRQAGAVPYIPTGSAKQTVEGDDQEEPENADAEEKEAGTPATENV